MITLYFSLKFIFFFLHLFKIIIVLNFYFKKTFKNIIFYLKLLLLKKQYIVNLSNKII